MRGVGLGLDSVDPDLQVRVSHPADLDRVSHGRNGATGKVVRRLVVAVNRNRQPELNRLSHSE